VAYGTRRDATAEDVRRAAETRREADGVWDQMLLVEAEVARLDRCRTPPAPPMVDPAPTVTQVIAAALSPRRTGVLARLFG